MIQPFLHGPLTPQIRFGWIYLQIHKPHLVVVFQLHQHLALFTFKQLPQMYRLDAHILLNTQSNGLALQIGLSKTSLLLLSILPLTQIVVLD